jgi:hypothetical protein
MKPKMKKNINYVAMQMPKLSSSFMVRCRCKHCGQTPDAMYYVRQISPEIGPEETKKINGFFAKAFKKFINTNRLISDFYLQSNPSEFTDLKYFNVRREGNAWFNPHLHKNKGFSLNKNYMQYFTCKCGKAQWAFCSGSSVEDKMEIFHRKAKRNFRFSKSH